MPGPKARAALSMVVPWYDGSWLIVSPFPQRHLLLHWFRARGMESKGPLVAPGSLWPSQTKKSGEHHLCPLWGQQLLVDCDPHTLKSQGRVFRQCLSLPCVTVAKHLRLNNFVKLTVNYADIGVWQELHGRRYHTAKSCMWCCVARSSMYWVKKSHLCTAACSLLTSPVPEELMSPEGHSSLPRWPNLLSYWVLRVPSPPSILKLGPSPQHMDLWEASSVHTRVAGEEGERREAMKKITVLMWIPAAIYVCSTAPTLLDNFYSIAYCFVITDIGSTIYVIVTNTRRT